MYKVLQDFCVNGDIVNKGDMLKGLAPDDEAYLLSTGKIRKTDEDAEDLTADNKAEKKRAKNEKKSKK